MHAQKSRMKALSIALLSAGLSLTAFGQTSTGSSGSTTGSPNNSTVGSTSGTTANRPSAATSPSTTVPSSGPGANRANVTQDSSTAGKAPTPGTGSTSGKAGSSGAAVSADDRKFMEKAAMDGMAEVELGKLAQQKGQSDAVKQFGARMEKDHSKAGDELKQIASSKGVTLPSAPDAKHKKKMDDLGKKSGAAFDRAYADDMVKDHKSAVADFNKASKSAKDSDVRGFAGKTLPTLEEHLKMAQDTEKSVKTAKK